MSGSARGTGGGGGTGGGDEPDRAVKAGDTAGPGEGSMGSRPTTGRIVAIGCFMTWIGGFSGAMFAVLLSKFAAFLTKAPKCSGIPTCDWYIYAAVGAGIGALTLPWLVVSALRRAPAADAESSDDKN